MPSKTRVSLRLCILVAFAASCSRSESSSAAAPRAEAPAEAPAPVAEAPAPAPSPCEAMLAEFNRVRDTAPNGCASHEDCAWAPAFTDCGRVTDRATATKMRELRHKALTAGCRGTVRCAKRALRHAICANGRCVPGPHRSEGPLPPYVPSASADGGR